MRILFLTRYGPHGGSSRYMTYDYLQYYERAGFECCMSPLFDDRYFTFGTLSRPTGLREILSHAGYYVQRVSARLKSLAVASTYDLVILEKELLPYVPFGLEAWLKRRQPNLVVMYDDATHVYYQQHPYRFVRMLCRNKIPRILGISKCVVVWNEILATYARQFNHRVYRVDTGFDLRRYQPKEYTTGKEQPSCPVVIGWIGTPNSFPYIGTLEQVFARLARRYDVEFCVISSEEYSSSHIKVTNKRWAVATEVENLRAADIGIMPLADNEWTRGKSGCKALQYMAVALPVVCSPVGVNTQIVQNGINGFLAATPQEWESALSTLIEDRALRRRQGEAGRRLVEASHSQETTAERLIDILRGVVREHK